MFKELLIEIPELPSASKSDEIRAIAITGEGPFFFG
jgi:hypothetical protein